VAELALARWLPLATSAAPLWARRAAADGLDPRELTTLDALAGLPPVRELDLLVDDPGAAAAVVRPTEDHVKAFGGGDLVGRVVGGIRREGADGKRRVILQEYQPVDLRRAGAGREVVVASSRSDLDRLNRVGARAADVLGLTDRDVLLGAVPMGSTLPAAHATHLAQGASITALHARGHGDDLTEVVAAAGLLPATVLLVPLEDALGLARTLADERVALPRLRRVVTYGPPLDEELRAELAAAYAPVSARADVRAVWGPPFGRTLWAECEEGDHGLHTSPDLEVLEVVDPMTGQVTDGDGDLTLTSLDWHGTALVRLRTGTWVDPLRTEPCPGCGRTVPRLVGDVAPWAWQLPMRDDDGRQPHVDLRGVPTVLEGLDGVTAWRAEVRGPDERVPRDRLLVEVAGDLGRAQRTGLEERLGAACGIPVHLTVGVHHDEVRRTVDELGGVFADLR
jgi:hypothetical protein